MGNERSVVALRAAHLWSAVGGVVHGNLGNAPLCGTDHWFGLRGCVTRDAAPACVALARQANRLLICDTDLLTTCVWSDFLFGDCPDCVRQEALRRRYDLYLLTDIDVPWIDDTQRYLAQLREGARSSYPASRLSLDTPGPHPIIVYESSCGYDETPIRRPSGSRK